MLVLAGIDEAGYGPMLGPLTLGISAFVLEDDDAVAGPPDLWERLADAVCRSPRDARGRIAVDDSKQLKGTGRRPLAHLERGVLAFLGDAARDAATNDAALLAALGVEPPGRPWYGGEPLALPSGTDAGAAGIDAARLRRTLAAAGVSEVLLAARAVDAREFNDGVDRLGSKAGLNLEGILQLAETIRTRFPDRHPRILVDRQGGRARYADALRAAWPEARVRVLGETEAVGRYRLAFPDGELTISFEQAADERHLPVALGSMAAKLVRELLMRRLNRWFADHEPGLRPTAGYVADARRWLDEAAPLLFRLGIERSTLVRHR